MLNAEHIVLGTNRSHLRFNSSRLLDAGEIRVERDPLPITLGNALAARLCLRPLLVPLFHFVRVRFAAQSAKRIKEISL